MINICLIQARLSSNRLPRKVIQNLYNSLTPIQILYSRLTRSNKIDKIIFVIPDSQDCDELYDYIFALGIEVHRGHPFNLVDRYLTALTPYPNCNIIRITSDCPLVDPYWVDKAVELKLSTKADYCSNYTPAETSRFCNGSDIEIFNKKLLLDINRFFNNDNDLEHVTFPLWDGRMKDIVHYRMTPDCTQDYSDVRITLDYQNDLLVLRRLLDYLDDIHAPLSSIVEAYRHLGLQNLNGSYHYSEGW